MKFNASGAVRQGLIVGLWSFPGDATGADRSLMAATIRPHDVGTYVEQLQAKVSAPSVKQQLAAIRMMFD
jgi:hypothetical protein